MTVDPRLQMQDSDVMTIGELRKNDAQSSALWVLNTSDLMGTRAQGDVLISVDMPNGRPLVVPVPKTWIPIDLSTYARRDLIMESVDFLQAVQRMTLTPVKPEFADNMMKRPDVRDERNYLALRHGGREFNAPGLTPKTGGPLAPFNTGDVLDAVSPRVISVMEADTDQMSPAVKLISLKGLASEIDGQNLRYILSKCSGPEYEPIQRWANDMARAIQSTGGKV